MQTGRRQNPQAASALAALLGISKPHLTTSAMYRSGSRHSSAVGRKTGASGMSRWGGGSCFFFLPIAQAEPAPQQAPRQAERAAAAARCVGARRGCCCPQQPARPPLFAVNADQGRRTLQLKTGSPLEASSALRDLRAPKNECVSFTGGLASPTGPGNCAPVPWCTSQAMHTACPVQHVEGFPDATACLKSVLH